MSELNGVEVGDWVTIVSTIKGSTFMLQQVTSVTSGLVKTQNYTFFRRDGRAFSTRQKSLTCRRATDSEIEQWLSRHGKQHARSQSNGDEQPEILLARYLKSVSEEGWAPLGVAQLKKIRAALERSQAK